MSARLTTLKSWCVRKKQPYTILARAQWLKVPKIRIRPAATQARIDLGAPVTTEAFVATIANAEILPRQYAVLSDDGCLFVDGLVNWPQYYPQNGDCVRHASDDLRLLLELPHNRVACDMKCALLGGAEGHFRWMFESLARLWALEQVGLLSTIPLVVPEDLSMERRSLLEAIGVTTDQIISLPQNSSLAVSELVVSSLLTIGDWVSPIAIQFLRRKLSPARGERRRRIFLSRRGAEHARLSNEAELLPLLERYDFQVIDCLSLSPLDLMALLVDASAVVACDDDSLANLVVAPQGTSIAIIVSEGMFRARAHFVASQLGHQLTYLVAQPDFETNSVHALCNFSLPPELLMEFLGELRVE